MKKLLTLSACILFGISSFAQDHTVYTQYGRMNGGGAEVDLNNDGYLDLIIGGKDRDDNWTMTVMLFDPATKEYIEQPALDFALSDRPHFVFADLNGDGILDLLGTESGGVNERSSGYYEGRGDGTFIKKELVFSDPSYKFSPSAVDVADFNNDGLLDIIAIGNGGTAALLINKGNYEFEVTYTDVLQPFEFTEAIVKVMDFNNDGYMDFFVAANCDGNRNNGSRPFSDLFLNSPENPGEFTRMYLGEGTIIQRANGGLDIADFDNDGFLDIVLHGEIAEGTQLSRMYLNQGGVTVAEKAQSEFPLDLRPLNSSRNTTRAIDWTGNGYFDLFIPGWCEDMPGGAPNTQAAFLFTNDGEANMSVNRMPGGSEAFIMLPDWNGDGTKDYFMIGQTWDNNYFNEAAGEMGRTSAIVLNTNEKAIRPSAPSNLNVEVNGSTIIISWEAAEGALNNISYEYFIKDTNTGKLLTSCTSHIGGELDGVRKVNQLGNAMLNKTITLYNIPVGDFLCGVQAINAAYDGSVFTTVNFTTDTTFKNVSESDTELILVGAWDKDAFEELYNGNITSVDFMGVIGLDEIPSNLAETNCMIYLPQNSELSLENANVVKGNTATNILISDALPFNNVKEITVESISYSRVYDAGYYSICLPFNCEVPTGIEAKQLSSEKESVLTFTAVTEMIANTPYIVYLENDAEIVFVSDASIVLPVTSGMEAREVVSEGGSYTLKGTFVELKENLVGKYLLNGDGSGFGIVTDAVAESSSISAFRAYIEYTGGNPQSAPAFLTIGNGDGGATDVSKVALTSELLFSSSNGVLEIYANNAQLINIYSLDGCLIKEVQLQEGVNRITGLSRGIYLANKQKVVIQ